MADTTIKDLEIMKNATRYRRWLFEQVSPYLGHRILEIGAGIGNYTEFFLNADAIVCIEIHPEAISILRDRFGSNPNVVVYQGDIADPTLCSLRKHRCDTAICFNVLEHVERDVAALKIIANMIVPGGRLLLIVPALPAIFGPVDQALGHYRRYTMSSLRFSLDQAGFQIEHISWMNSLGILGWLFNGYIMRRAEESPGQITFYDRLVVPWLRILERFVRPPIGLSLVVVAQALPREMANSPESSPGTESMNSKGALYESVSIVCRTPN